MSQAQHDTAIAYLIAQHVQESAQAFRQSEPQVVAVTMNPEPTKTRHVKNESAPMPRKPSTPGITLPERGSLGAKDFLLALRNAGKRLTAEGRPFVDHNEVRNDQIKAIHGFYYEVRKGVRVYIGYDWNRDFGSQDAAARMLAQRELRGAPRVVDVPKPSLSVAGYVAGVPDIKARRLGNLYGQEVIYADAMIQHEKDANNLARSEADRALSAALALAEQERLASIRRQIAELL
jgi:hypothetical protein